MRYVDAFDVVLFDMNGTFAEGHDRFGPDEDYFATYRSIGGQTLDRAALMQIMRPTCEALLRMYEAPEYTENFPSLREAFREFGGASDADLPALEQLFAEHELGAVPDAYQPVLRDLARTHRLGVVSNICAHPDLWLPQHVNKDIFDLFTVRVFSSEGRSLKPSVSLFQRTLAHFQADARVLFVGDSLERDVMPAKALGMATVWIAPAGSAHPDADRVIESLVELATLR